MRDIFKHCKIDDKYEYKMQEASLSKVTGKLTVEVGLNFVIPVSEVEKAEEILIKNVPGVSQVEFIFDYDKEMAMDKKEAVGHFLEHMIRKANGRYCHLTNSIRRDRFEFDEGTVSQMITDAFGYSAEVIFVNDSEAYNQAEKDRRTPAAVIMKMPPTADLAATDVKENNEGKKDKKEKKGKSKEKPKVVGNRIFGKAFSGEAMPMTQFSELSGDCILEGEVFGITSKTIKSGKLIVTILFSDKKTSVCGKCFMDNDRWELLDENLKEGDTIRVSGTAEFDSYANTPVLMIKALEKVPKKVRTDDAEEKRVELHAHTKMSAMDGLSDVKEYVKRAKAWGHKAVAITDHGVVQAFPEAAKAAGGDIKIIYGDA